MPATVASEALGRLEHYTAGQTAQWEEQLRFADHDFYHSAAFHQFSQEQGEGEAFLAVYKENDSRRLLWPYLRRPIEGLGSEGYFDVTSVYGYPGPLGLGCEGDEPFLQRAYDSICDLWKAQRVVAAFTRLHPILENHRLFAPQCPPTPHGETVSIDLTQDPEAIWLGYRKDVRPYIKKARRAGVVVTEDTDLRQLDRFIELYHQTMQRKRAAKNYFFSRDYFRRFFERLGARAYLMIAELEGRVLAGGIFVEYDGIVQYHLSASDEEFRRLAPTKLLLEEVRLRSAERGNHTFHLGGGTGGSSDSLFEFKSSFSRRKHPFHIWSAVIEPAAYEELCRRRNEADPLGAVGNRGGFFPAYRRPCLTKDVPSKLGPRAGRAA